ncbi:MAG: hypothetical protein E6K06_05850 [Methanobacteriota archaeon]|nr:MAG: hypothetical protein E6K09_02250 [Euryarchaeota archaeon]TLZ71555.1 MAG: hypothetical protein E6K06_05850 [Euryarchaeota archaeon]TLZ75883.1 MAG: hypothetical protein E6K08_07615 [Euryarchaeota archaeon]TLZ78840.1 MAG: hypothetical protein E6K11_08065 [Euryarchaeota archaeon]
MSTLSFHFHGYQPGDIVRWSEPDPLRPQTFEERHSPVVHRIGPERMEGRNWTDAVLHAYGRMGSVVERASGSASVDIEPQTLSWLLKRDSSAFHEIVTAYNRGTVGFVMTPPFHPILPHLHRQEREALFDMMIDFYAPLIPHAEDRSIGLWLPEAAYSRETIDSFRESVREASLEQESLAESLRGTYLIVDARQFIRPPEPGRAWVHVESTNGLLAIARDHSLSGEFAFGSTTASEFGASVQSRGSGSFLVASDLESLLANPNQVERFEAIVRALRERGVRITQPVPAGDGPTSALVDYSSWSDYDGMLSSGVPSDTRWTGLRRSDGLVVSRTHRDRPLSQLWKHGFTLATERVETAVRRRAFHLLRSAGVTRRTQVLRRLAVAYGRHWFREHYRAQGFPTKATDIATSAEEILGGKVDIEAAGFLARGYVLMLMGTRSDPRFWDNPDTRVTFQNVVLLAQALRDLAEASLRLNDASSAAALRRLLQATFLEFSEWLARGEFAALQSTPAWETTDAAWYSSLESEVPTMSPLDVMKRAAMFALAPDGEWPGGDPVPSVEGTVADTGHIVGEAHGEWANPRWCEHRIR